MYWLELVETMDAIYWVNFRYTFIIYLQTFTQQFNISYREQRFQQSTRFDQSVSINEYNLSIKSI
jgi:hypothetical protein